MAFSVFKTNEKKHTVIINTSQNVSILDSRIIADLCGGFIYADLTPTVYIADGIDNVLGAFVQIKNPLGVIVKPYADSYELTPATSGGMLQAVSFPVPTQAGGYQLGAYQVDVKLVDADLKEYVVSKTVQVCAPDTNYPTRKYGLVSARFKGVCSSGRMFVIVDSVPVYNGKISESQENDFTLEYPTGSNLDNLSTENTNFSVTLFEGIYKMYGEICASYNFGDNVYVKNKYKLKVEKNQKCIIDFCCVYSQLASLQKKRNEDCTMEEKEQTANTIIEALFLIRTAELAANCGEDPSETITELEGLLGCKCTCNCNEGVPIYNNEPSTDFVIEGCNVSFQVSGNTKTYTIDNYDYVVTTDETTGIISVSDPVLENCTKTFTVSFNLSRLYQSIKDIVNADANEWDFWAFIVNNTLDTIDPTCIGLTNTQWRVLTLKERIQAIINAFCSGAALCKAKITAAKAYQSGNYIVFEWNETGNSSVDLYFDGTLVANVLAGVGTYSMPFNPHADVPHTFLVMPKCSNGTQGQPSGGSVDSFARVFVAPPEVYSPYLVGAVPYDLTTNVLPLPFGISAEWHTQNNTLASTLVHNPTGALGGVYFVFAKDSNGVYSDSVQVQLVATASGSCSAPQNLTIVPVYGGTMIQFQSAAYPPPLNSYTVKRRFTSDPDVDGSYTTIGTPVWNASASRWVITDNTVASNRSYIYRVVSNCGGTNPYIDREYANILCPVVTLSSLATRVGYSLPEIGGDVDKVEVTIYSDNGYTPVHTDTHNAPMSNPITGNFFYLDPNKTYYVGVKAYIGTYSKSCPLTAIKTLSDEVTLTVDYIAGNWILALSDVIAQDVILKTAVATGSNDNCVTPGEVDTLAQDVLIPAGETYAEVTTGGLTYLSEKYSIANSVNIDGYGTLNDGDTFTSDDITVTLKINRLNCGYYPA